MSHWKPEYELSSVSSDDSDGESNDSGAGADTEDSNGDKLSEENPPKRIKTEDSQQRGVALAGPSKAAAAPAQSAQPRIHGRPQLPRDHNGEPQWHPSPWPKKILVGLDKFIRKYKYPKDTKDSVFVALHSVCPGNLGGEASDLELLGVFRSCENANVRVMEHFWQNYEDLLSSARVVNSTIEEYIHEDDGTLLWSINPKDGSLTLAGLDENWGDLKVWVEKREIEP